MARGGSESAGSDAARLAAIGGDQPRAAAHRLASLRLEADALMAGSGRDGRLKRCRADKAAFAAQRLGDGPEKPGIDRRRIGIDVLAVQAKTALEAQRVARGEARPLAACVGEQAISERRALFDRHGDLEPVLAGVAG